MLILLGFTNCCCNTIGCILSSVLNDILYQVRLCTLSEREHTDTDLTFVNFQTCIYCFFHPKNKWLIVFVLFVLSFPFFSHPLLVCSCSTTRPLRQCTRSKTLWKLCWTCCRDTGRRQGIKWQRRAAASSRRPASFLLCYYRTSTALWSVVVTHRLKIYEFIFFNPKYLNSNHLSLWFFFFSVGMQEVLKLPKVLDRIRSIYRLTTRKHKMDAERTVIKQKMNASINGSFFIPATPRKSHPAPKYV